MSNLHKSVYQSYLHKKTKERSQVEKDKCQMISLICGVNEAKLKEQNSSRLRDSKKELVVTKGEGCEWGQVRREGEED